MLSFDVLPVDILLQIVASLSLRDTVSLSMVNNSFYTLSQEHSFWLEPLRTAKITQPIPCATMDDLAARSTDNLKQLALHTVRLTRNWSDPLPQITGPVETFPCGVHNNILYCLPGTDAIVLYSLAAETIICADVKTGESSQPMFVGRIVDMSSPLEERTSFTVAALVDGVVSGVHTIVVLRATIHPAVATSVVFKRDLDPGYIYYGIFMTGGRAGSHAGYNSPVVGLARAPRGGSIEVQSFNLLNPKLSTIIVTDRPRSHVLGSTVIGDTVYFIVLQSKDAFVYACPPRLLAYAEPSPETDYSIQRSHVARIPRPPDPSDSDSTSLPQPPPLTRVDYCVLSTEPNHGRNTISVANIMRTAPDGRQIPHSLEITFWPRPVRPARTAFKSDEEYERAEGKLMLPAQTVTIPGSLTNQPGNAWELLVIANSGLAVVLVVDPPPDPDAPPPADGFGGELDEEAALLALERRPAPKLVMARYDPVRASVSMHELQIPAGTGEGDLRLDTRGICALAFDDHRGFVIVVTVHRVLHYIPYA